MSFLVVFVTRHSAVIDTITKRKVSLIPSDIRAKGFAALGGEEVVLSSYRVTDRSTIDELLTHVSALDLSTASGVIMLTDDSLPGLTDSFGDVFSVNRFKPPSNGSDTANALTAILAKALRANLHLMRRFNDLKYHKILRLPLRNFDAAVTNEMREICHDMMNKDNFGRQLDNVLHLFRRRQRPKKASSRPDVYLVDDMERHFRFGHEIHARADTACPPHNKLCILGNKFRFGRAFDGTRHFNVSRDGGLMTDQYIDCHDISRSGFNALHLNMFSNDFF